MDSSPLTAKDCFVGLKNSTWYEIVLSTVIEKYRTQWWFLQPTLPLLLIILRQNNLININSKIRLLFQPSADRFLYIKHFCNVTDFSTEIQLILV